VGRLVIHREFLLGEEPERKSKGGEKKEVNQGEKGTSKGMKNGTSITTTH